jgi:pimeloyl-ACP methyl ester carboxylesterase
MTWTLRETAELADGVVRWASFGEGPPIVLVHGTPYSSYLWRDVALALARHGRHVYVFDHLGYGQSDKHEGQDLTLAAQGRNFAELLRRWNLRQPSVVACDIGGAIVLRALFLEDAAYSDLTLFDAVTGGTWEHGLFALIREHHDVFERLPAYAHEALVTSHLRNGTHAGYRPGVLETYLEPWLGADGQAAFYRQYRQLAEADTAAYEHLLGTIDIPVTLLWGRDDRILPAPHGHWISERVTNLGLTWIDDAGHLLPEDAPAQLVEHLTRPWGPRSG